MDSRHPGLRQDIEAWHWLSTTVERCALVATKIDKLSRAERTQALKRLETVFEDSVLPFSAVTGEGLDQLWTLIDHLANSPNLKPRSRHPAETTPPRPRKK